MTTEPNPLRAHAAELRRLLSDGSGQEESLPVLVRTGTLLREELDRHPGMNAAVPTRLRLVISDSQKAHSELQEKFERAQEAGKTLPDLDVEGALKSAISITEGLDALCEPFRRRGRR